MTPTINWARLARAVEYYQGVGYTYLEVPWIVSAEATAVTLPDGARAATLAAGGDLVGSAEQSFIQMLRRNLLPNGRYVALTPCFRHETQYNDLYQPYFMKVELIDVGGSPDDVEPVLSDALTFLNREAWSFERMLAPVQPISFMDGSIDLQLNGIEVGSYGFRQHNGLQWVYGTGLAEPRFSVALR